MSPIRTCALSVLLIPALALTAADKTYPGTTKSNPPPVSTSGSYLIDKTVPAYGVLNQVPHYSDSRANALYLEIHQVLADVESQIMGGTASAVADASKKKNQDAAPAPVGDARIGALLTRLVELDARITYRTHLEQWHIDNSFSNLSRATDMLALSGRVTAATVEKVQGAKPKSPAEAPAAVAPAAVAPAAPAVEAPTAVEAPPAPAPAVEAPPAVEPAVEAPAVEAPPAAAPAADAPPVVEPPAAEAPAVDAPPAVEPPADQ